MCYFVSIFLAEYQPIFCDRSGVNLPNLGIFSFQRNENSVQVRVALLLYMAFGNSKNVTVAPSLDIELPFKKRGPPYQSDFVIMTKEQTPTEASKPSSSSTTGMVLYQSNVPAMIIEVKIVVAMDFKSVKAHECIEMLIYCLYILRIQNLQAVLGCITDGKVWHVLRVRKIDNGARRKTRIWMHITYPCIYYRIYLHCVLFGCCMYKFCITMLR